MLVLLLFLYPYFIFSSHLLVVCAGELYLQLTFPNGSGSVPPCINRSNSVVFDLATADDSTNNWIALVNFNLNLIRNPTCRR